MPPSPAASVKFPGTISQCLQTFPTLTPTIVLDLLQAFRCSKAMFAAVSIGVFDALATGPKSLPVLADELKANPDALERLLGACVGLTPPAHPAAAPRFRLLLTAKAARTHRPL